MMVPTAQLTLFLGLLAIPLIEIAGVLIVGQLIGFWPTISLLIGAAVLGILVLRLQGIKALKRMFDAAWREPSGQPDALESLLLMLAGVLLIFPGFVSDLAALVLISPLSRGLVIARLRSILGVDGQKAPSAKPDAQDHGGGRHPGADGPIIEVDFERLSERPISPRPKQER